VVECGGLENRYVGNPGVGGSNPPLSAHWSMSAIQHAALQAACQHAVLRTACQLVSISASQPKPQKLTC
jgi:hypothetical protein